MYHITYSGLPEIMAAEPDVTLPISNRQWTKLFRQWQNDCWSFFPGLYNKTKEQIRLNAAADSDFKIENNFNNTSPSISSGINSLSSSMLPPENVTSSFEDIYCQTQSKGRSFFSGSSSVHDPLA